MKLPKLPTAICSILGPIPVGELDPEERKGAFAKFYYGPREIAVSPDQAPIAAWQSLFHELTHVALWDAGVHNILDEKIEEAVCDAVGALLAHMLAGGQLKFERRWEKEQNASTRARK